MPHTDPVEFYVLFAPLPIVSPATKLACAARSDKVSGETLCSLTKQIPMGRCGGRA